MEMKQGLRACFLLLVATLWLQAPHCLAAARFAVIGDYGADTPHAIAVANMVKSVFQPDFIVTVGDNNYGGPDDIDRNIGKYYHEFIGNYRGGYGPGAADNRFFPAIGNHDYDPQVGYGAYLDYFTLPGNGRYYDVRQGPVHLFIVNSDSHEPDGTSSNSTQARWLSDRLNFSNAPWKLVSIQRELWSDAGDRNGFADHVRVLFD
jgi:tartrate-resistant acid phosphatase type 5